VNKVQLRNQLLYLSGSLFALLSLICISCSDSPTGPAPDQVVVRGYLYAGQPVRDIFLSGTLQIGDESTEGPSIDDATVSLAKGGTSYTLVRDSLRPGYYIYPGSDLIPAPNEVFSLDIVRGGSHVTATTTVPSSPSSVTASPETLAVYLETIFDSFTRVRSDDTLLISWTASSTDLYYTVMQNVDPNPTLITEDTLAQGFASFISQPAAQLQYRVPTQILRYTGKHMVHVYHVNQEYADLYRSRQQDTRNLNEPLTNVKNGLGVFTAFASDSVSVYIKLQ